MSSFRASWSAPHPYLAAISNVGRRVKLDLFAEPSTTDVQHISKIHDKLFIALSGLATDAQTLYQRLVFWHKLYQLCEERDMKPERPLPV